MRDFSSFKVRAWCFDPERLHSDMDLHIIEPDLDMQQKRCLTYKISIRFFPANLQSSSMVSQPPLPPASDGGPDANEDRNKPDQQPRHPGGSQDPRRPVHLCLGPQGPRGRGHAKHAPRALDSTPKCVTEDENCGERLAHSCHPTAYSSERVEYLVADAQISCIPEEGVDIHQSNIMKATTGACDINDPARALSLHDGLLGLNQADLAPA